MEKNYHTFINRFPLITVRFGNNVLRLLICFVLQRTKKSVTSLNFGKVRLPEISLSLKLVHILWFSFSSSIFPSSSSVQFTTFFSSSTHSSITFPQSSSIIDIINSPSITVQPSNSSNWQYHFISALLLQTAKLSNVKLERNYKYYSNCQISAEFDTIYFYSYNMYLL